MNQPHGPQTNDTSRHPPALCVWSLLLLLAMLLGTGLRAREYLAKRSFWLDEVFLALGIVQKPWTTLFTEPLPHNQVAAPGFVAATKLCATIAGPNEWSLRLVPFLAGVAALIVFARVARRWLSPPHALLAMLLFAVSDHLIYYATEFKPYSLDVLATTLALDWALAEQTEQRVRVRDVALLSALLLSSFTAAILLAAAGLYRIAVARARLGEVRRLVALALSATPAVAANWLLGARFAARNTFLYDYWHYAFPNVPPRSLEDWNWFIWTFRGLFEHAFDAWSYLLVGALVAVGAVGHRKGLLGGSVIAVALGLAAARLYPFHGRTVLYLTPVVCLLVAAGLETVGRGRAAWLARVLIAALLLVPPGTVAAQYALKPRRRAPIRPLLEVLAHQRPGPEEVVTTWAAGFMYDYYRSILGLPARRPSGIAEWSGEPFRYRTAVQQALGDKPCWVVYYGIVDWRRGPIEAVAKEMEVLQSVLHTMGSVRELYRGPGAVLYRWRPRRRRASGDAKGSQPCRPHGGGVDSQAGGNGDRVGRS